MSRYKTFVADGSVPNGTLYVGDLNAIEDQMADLSNFAQTVDVSTLRLGDTSIALLKYGSAEARLTAAMRTDGILRGLGGLYAGAFTTAQRDAIGLGFRPPGLVIFNTDLVRHQFNKGTDVTPVWGDLGSTVLPTGNIWIASAGMWGSLTSGASGPLQVEMATNKENVWVMDFVDGSTTYSEVSFVMPNDYNGGTLTAFFTWIANTASTAAVRWQIQADAFGDNTALDAAWGTAQQVTDANQGTNVVNISAVTPAFTLGGAPAAGKLAAFRVARLGADGADTLTSTARLLGVTLTYSRQ